MITYNPRDWFHLITMFHKSDTFRRLLPAMIGIALLSAMVVYVEVDVLHIHRNITVVHSILGFVLSMLLVFRTNTAYERWWEGRKAWGDLVNHSRNFALKLKSFWKGDSEKLKVLLITLSKYPEVLKTHLRAKASVNESVQGSVHHLPMEHAKLCLQEIENARKSGHLTDNEIWLMNSEISSWMQICGVCERIKNTPIPFSYNIFLKKIIFIYVITIPFMFSPDFGYLTVFIAPFVLYFFASLELIAEEIEDPFGTDDNDLPLDALCTTIKHNIESLIQNQND